MKLKIKTENIDFELDNFNSTYSTYLNEKDGVLGPIKEIIQKISDENQKIIKTKYENKDSL